MVRFGDIKPEGWIKEEIKELMNSGIGHLDELLPSLLKDHEIYGKDRLSSSTKQWELGRNDCDLDQEVSGDEEQFFWWNSESQSNWRDGFCRNAYLLEDEVWEKKANEYVNEMLKKQDTDGYMGIYQEDLRFHFHSENGELWAQSTLFRALLGCYEATGDEKILNAIKHAAARVMKGYPKGDSHPFGGQNVFAGHSHGLTIVDAFYRLYELTGEKQYVDYAVWLYEDYCEGDVAEEDLQKKNIEDPDYILYGHGVHTYEHIRALIIAAYEKEEYKKTLNLLWSKLPYYIVPSGAPIGDEWLFRRVADPLKTGYEYCSLQELMDTYLFMMRKSNDLRWADKAEWLFYNASFGMRLPGESSIMYCKTDNCYEVDEHRQAGDGVWNPRYKYSPTHQDVAVCCVPNSGRTIPYFVQSMLVETQKGWKIGLYGPCRYTGKIQDVGVEIRQVTKYPFSGKIQIEVCPEKPVYFQLCFRIPCWATNVKVNGKEMSEGEIKNREICIEKSFSGKENITLEFGMKVDIHKDYKEDYYISRGPILYAVEIPAKEKHIKKLNIEPYVERGFLPEKQGEDRLKITRADAEAFYYSGADEAKDWKDLSITGIFTKDGAKEERRMVPFGKTILRKTTFERSY